MGTRGPAPKPTELKRLQGNPGRRPLGKDEAQPDTVLMYCPRWMSDVAKAKWRQIAPRLRHARLLTEVDHDLLSAFCVAFARWQEADGMVQKQGQVITSKNGSEYLSPWLVASSMAFKEMISIAAKFGMSPSDRTRIKIEKDEKEKSLAEVLFEKVENG